MSGYLTDHMTRMAVVAGQWTSHRGYDEEDATTN